MKFSNNMYILSIITKVNIILMTFISSAILNRYLGPSLRGEYAYIVNFIGLISLILTLSITKSYPFFSRKYGDDIEKVFVNLVYYLGLLYFFIGLAISLVSSINQILLIVLITLFSYFYQQITFLGMLKNFKLKSKISLVETLLYLIILLFIFIFDFDEKLFVVLIGLLMKNIIGTILFVIKFKIYPKKSNLDVNMVLQILKFSFIPTVTALLITLNYKVDIIILERYVGFGEIGLYSLGVTLASMLWILPDAFKDVLFNKTAKSDAIEDITFSIKFNVFVSVLVVFIFYILGSLFIQIVYGVDYINAKNVTLILFLGNVPMIFFKMINTLFIAQGKQLFTLKVLVMSVFLNVILNIILIPNFGIEGAATASVISYSVSGLLFLYFFSKLNNIKLSLFFLLTNDDLNKLRKIKFKRRK